MRLEFGGSKAGRVLERGRSERVDSVLDDPEIDQQAARAAGRPLRRCSCRSSSRGEAIGVVIAHDKLGRRRPRSPTTTSGSRRRSRRAPRSPSTCPSGSSRDALRRVVEAQELERSAARARAPRRDRAGADVDPARAQAARAERGRATTAARPSPRCGSSSSSTLQDVRRLAVELRPAALDDFGLVPALERLVETLREQTGIAGRPRGAARRRAAAERGRDGALPDRPGGAHERRQARGRAAASASCSRAGRASVAAVVEDDGRGLRPGDRARGRPRARRHARAGRRSSAAGSTIESTPGSGTTLVAEVPLR